MKACRTFVMIGALLFAAAAAAQTADNVLVVINQVDPASIQVGEYYAGKRAIAADHVVRIKTATTEAIARPQYEAEIEAPIGAWLARHSLQDRILYIVLTKGVPLRILGSEGRVGTTASVDSELTLLYRTLVGTTPVAIGQTANPYFLDRQAVAHAKRFTRFVSDIYLVTRLDGYTVDDVMGLIDRGIAPERDGRIVLDKRAQRVDGGGDRWLTEAADRLRASGHENRVLLESTTALAITADPILGYSSWGSNDPANRLRQFGFNFAKGALATMFLSTDGRSFREPPSEWVPEGRQGVAGARQSLIGDLIRDGVTGVAGQVAEPFLGASIRPQILFPAYLAGFNLAEAFYLAMPFLSWQTIVVGDPLCAPFAQQPLPTTEIAKDIDPKTKFPGLLSERRLAAISRGALRREGLELAMRAEAEQAQGNTTEIEPLLVRATETEPRLDSAHISLAEIYQRQGKTDAAIDRYRRVLANNSRDIAALNNLAYALAVDKQSPGEALPLAERAFRLAPIPLVTDTLGWIHHLMGNNAAALPYLEQALAGAPGNVDIAVHLAFVHAAVGDTARAAKELDRAVQRDAALAERADVKALRERLQRK